MASHFKYVCSNSFSNKTIKVFKKCVNFVVAFMAKSLVSLIITCLHHFFKPSFKKKKKKKKKNCNLQLHNIIIFFFNF